MFSDIHSNSLGDDLFTCPICGQLTCEAGEREYIDFGYYEKTGPDHCSECGYVEPYPQEDVDARMRDMKERFAAGRPLCDPPLPNLHRVLNDGERQWIANNVEGTGYGKCHRYAIAMAEAFGYRTVHGTYYCTVWGLRAHSWCVDRDNYVVDPTAAQFPSRGLGVYDGDVIDSDRLSQLAGLKDGK